MKITWDIDDYRLRGPNRYTVDVPDSALEGLSEVDKRAVIDAYVMEAFDQTVIYCWEYAS